jgi:hypothetical protein
MSVIKQVIVCDWPKCTATIPLQDVASLTAIGWQDLLSPWHDPFCEHPWHACPEHRRRSAEDFQRAIERHEAL